MVPRPLQPHKLDFDDSDNEDSSYEKSEDSSYPTVWGPVDKVYHDDALVYTMSGLEPFH
jgi:hypothetical protein